MQRHLARSDARRKQRQETTKQCNSENTLIMLMATKLYSRVSAETYDMTLLDDAAEINSNQEEPAKSPSGSATGSAQESQEGETEEVDAAAAKKIEQVRR